MGLGGLVITIATLAANWMIFRKMGRKGWEGIIPIYNMYVLCDVLYGKGIKFLLFLIPLYNIYFLFKVYIDLAHAFNKSTGFGIGLVLLNTIFTLILGFSNAQYGDGSAADTTADFVSNTFEKAKEATAGLGKDPNAADKIEKLNELRAQGVISDEEFEAKKAELLKRM